MKKIIEWLINLFTRQKPIQIKGIVVPEVKPIVIIKKMKLSDESRNILDKQLRVDEGCILHVYKDSLGLYTIGIGRCLETKGLSVTECNYLNLDVYDKKGVIDALKVRGITQVEADQLLSNDINEFTDELYNRITWIESAPEVVKIVLLNMAFNLGIAGLMSFHTTLGLIQSGNYIEASNQMLLSKWKDQVGDRAVRLSNLLASCN